MVRTQLNLAIALVLSIVPATLPRVEVPIEPRARCERTEIESCAIRHGRFSTQNGISQVIWLVGTSRKVHVVNDAADFLPADVVKYTEMTSPDHSDIFGDFTICPTQPDVPGHMGEACVANAKNLVVQPVDKSRPPFRVRSTWSDPVKKVSD